MSDDKKRNDEKCRYCHKPGQKENVCFKKQREVAHHAEEESEDAYALITGVNIPKLFKDEDKENNTHDDIWIGDTGATCHMTNSTIGFWDVQPYKGIVDVATGTKTMVTHVGKIKGKVLYKDRTKTPIILKNVKVVPGLVKNLFFVNSHAQ